jgi:hypothetical protein
MNARDRREIRYEQFVKRRRRRWPWIVALFVLLVGGGVGASLVTLAHRTVHDGPPPALSHDGRPVPGETYQWAHVAVGGGGFITGLSFDASGQTFVIRTDVYGAYVWDKSGDRWVQMATADAFPGVDRVQSGIADGAYEIAVAPSDRNRIYLAIKGMVYRSDDRGAHFRVTGAGNPFPLQWDANGEFRLGGPFMAVDPANPGLVLLGTPQSGLWRSADGGASWRRVDSLVPGAAFGKPRAPMIWFEQSEGGKPTGRIWAMNAGQGMMVSSDHGASFARLSSDLAQPMTLRRGTFDRHGVFFGIDDASHTVWKFAGGHWQDLTRQSGLPSIDYAAITASHDADLVVMFSQSGQGFASVDGGQHWSNVAHAVSVGEGDPPWLKVSDVSYFATADVQFDPKVPGRLWVAAGTGVFYADFHAGSAVVQWVSLSRGIEELVANDIVQPTGQSPIFGGWDFGLRVMGRLDRYPATFGPNERPLISVQEMDWSPSQPATIITNASDARLNCCTEDGNSVMAGYSDDGGWRWTKFATLPVPPGTGPDDPRRMSFGSIAVSAGSPDNIVWEPAFNRAPFYTLDRGRTWQEVVLPGASGPLTGSFQVMFYQRKTVAADRVKPGVFYLYHSGDGGNLQLAGLWRTGDGGVHWEHVYSGEIAPASNMAAKLRPVPGHAGNLFFTAGFPHVSDTGLRRSTDGGQTWQVVPDVTRVDDIAFGKAAPGADYPAIYISGKVQESYGIWRSVDNARSWQRLTEFPAMTLDWVTAIAADPDVFGRVYLGYKGSGWIWGEPAHCGKPRYNRVTGVSCSEVGRENRGGGHGRFQSQFPDCRVQLALAWPVDRPALLGRAVGCHRRGDRGVGAARAFRTQLCAGGPHRPVRRLCPVCRPRTAGDCRARSRNLADDGRMAIARRPRTRRARCRAARRSGPCCGRGSGAVLCPAIRHPDRRDDGNSRRWSGPWKLGCIINSARRGRVSPVTGSPRALVISSRSCCRSWSIFPTT